MSNKNFEGSIQEKNLQGGIQQKSSGSYSTKNFRDILNKNFQGRFNKKSSGIQQKSSGRYST